MNTVGRLSALLLGRSRSIQVGKEIRNLPLAIEEKPSLADIVRTNDGFKPEAYLPIYERLFAPLREKPVALLELGIFHGGSLRSWEAYFTRGTIVGLDAEPPDIAFASGRVQMFAGRQEDTAALDGVAALVSGGFDIIIDDCAHVGALAKVSFWHLFENHLRPGGVYCIEDWGTGYWRDWPDGGRYEEFVGTGPARQRRFPSHDYGMVGFIKQLVDECHYDAVKETQGAADNRPSRFASMSIYGGLVVIEKPTQRPDARPVQALLAG